jgi:hypothetical protein
LIRRSSVSQPTVRRCRVRSEFLDHGSRTGAHSLLVP